MQLVAGIVIAVVGLLLLVSSFVSPALSPLRGAGGMGLVLGVACIGLSFVKPPDLDHPSETPLPLGARLSGIFFEPSKVFQNLRVHPRWASAVLVTVLFSAAYQAAFVQRITPDVIASTITQKSIETAEGFGQTLPPEAKAKMKEEQLKSFKSPAGRVAQALNVFTGVSLGVLFFGGLYTLLALAFGGRMNYWQGVAITAHAGLPVAVIGSILNLLVLFLKSPDDISPVRGLGGVAATDLGSLLFNPAEHPVLVSALGAFGLLSLYGLWMTATGLRHGSTKLSNGGAWGIALTLFVIGLLLRVGAAALFPSFVS